jgi:hypothetical protein
MKAALARLGIRGFNPKLKKAVGRLDGLRTPEGEPIPPNTLAANQSKRTCILASLAAREFLVDIGFRDATVRSVACVMRARSGEQLSVGAPSDDRVIDGLWNGHLVVTIPSLSVLIDLTLFPAIRRPWDKLLTGMWAIPLEEPAPFKIFDRRPIAGHVRFFGSTARKTVGGSKVTIFVSLSAVRQLSALSAKNSTIIVAVPCVRRSAHRGRPCARLPR